MILTFLFNFCWSDSGQSCSTWWNDHLCLSKCFLKISDVTLIKQMKHPGHQCWFKFLYNSDIKLMEFCYWNYSISHDIWNQAGKKIHRFASDCDTEAAFVAVPNRACCWISHVTIPCTRQSKATPDRELHLVTSGLVEITWHEINFEKCQNIFSFSCNFSTCSWKLCLFGSSTELIYNTQSLN